MSQTIDNRVVQMEFDNQGFERGVKTSLSSLEQLKKGLDLDKATASLQSLEETFNGFSLEGIEGAVDKVAEAFSGLGVIANTILSNIANRAVETGIRLTKALTVDNLGAGFSKYEQMMNATQTMKNATGKDVDEITGYLDKLMTYTDETSYSYTEMVTAMGRFTSAGVELNAAESAVQGIANAAADAGIGIHEANRLFDVFSKAMSSGHLGRNQWDSLALQNFNTPKFQKALIAAGKAVGTIDAKTGKIISKKKGTKQVVVTFENLAETLKSGWVNQEVLNMALAAYGDETDQVAKTLAEFDKELTNVGSSAYESAKVAKTFTDVIDSVKDAISSGWMTSFTNIFGGLEESMKFWTDVANGIIDIVDRIQERRNKMLGGWKANGGYEDLTAGINNVIAVFRALYDTATIAFGMFSHDSELALWSSEVGDLQYAKSIGEALLDITKSFREATESVLGFFSATEVGEKGDKSITYFQKDLAGIFRGLYGVIGIVSDLIGGLFHGVGSFFGKFAPVGRKMLEIFGKVGTAISRVYSYFHARNTVNTWFDTIIEGFKPIFDNIQGFIEWLDKLSEYVGLNQKNSQGFNKTLNESSTPLAKVVNGIKSLLDILAEFAGFGVNIFSQIIAAIAPYAGDFIYWIIDMAAGLGEWITKVKESGVITDILNDWSKKVGEAIETLKGWGKAAWEWIDSTGILEAIRSKFAGMFRWIKSNLFGQDITADLEAEIQHSIDRLNGNVTAAKQVTVDANVLKDAGYSNLKKGIDTLSATFGDQKFVFGMTPVLPDGTILSPNAFGNYIDRFMAFDKIEDAVNWDKENKGLLTQYLEVPDGKNVEAYQKKLLDTMTTVNMLNEEIDKQAEKNKAKNGGEEFVEETNKATGIVGKAQEALQFLHDKLEELATWLSTHSITKMLGDFFGAGAAFLSTAFTRLGGFFAMDTSKIEGTGNKLSARLDAFKNLDESGAFKKDDPFNGFVDFLKGLAVNLNGVDSVLKELGWDKGFLDGIFGTISYVTGKLGEIFHEFTSKFNLWDAAKAGVVGSVAVGGIKAIFDFFKTMANVKDATGLWGNIGSFTESASEIFETIKDEGIGGLIKGKTSLVKKFSDFSQALLMVGGGIWLMADAMNKLKDMDIAQIGKTLLGVGGAGGILGLVVEFTKDFEEKMSSTDLFNGNQFESVTKKYSSLWDGTTFIAIAGALNMLADGLKKLSEIEIADLGKGLLAQGAMGALLGVIKRFTESLNSSESIESGSLLGQSAKSVKKLARGAKLWDGIEFLAIAKAINMLGDGIKTLSELNEADLKKGLLAEGAMGALIGAIKFFSDDFAAEFKGGDVTKTVKKNSDFLSGLPFIEIAGALGMMADGLTKLSEMNIDEMKTALIGMTGSGSILLLLKEVSDAFNKNFTSGMTVKQSAVTAIAGSGISFMGIAEALNKMADALVKLKDIDDAWSEIAQLGAMGGIAAFLNGILGKTPTAVTQQALINIGVILGEVTGVLLAVGTLNDFLKEHGWDATEKLQEAGSVLYELGKAIGGLFGGFVEGFSGKTASEALVEEIAGEKGGMEEALAALQGFSDKLSSVNFDLIDRFMNTMTDLYGVINLSTIQQSFGLELEDLGDKFNKFATEVDEGTLHNAQSALRIAETFVRISKMLSDGDQLNAGETMADKLSYFLSGAELNGHINVGNLIGGFAAEFAKGFGEGLQNGSSETDSGVTVLMSNTLDSFADWMDDYTTMGKNISEGIANGIDSKESQDRVKEAMETIAGLCKKTFTVSVDEHSPSKLFAQYGRYLDDGLILGIEGGGRDVENAMWNLGDIVSSSAEAAMNDDFFFEPTISPIFDTSSIAAGMNYMNGEFSRVGDILPTLGRGTLQTELVSSTSSNGIIDAIDRVNLRVSELGEAIETMQIVMNGGALVGQITSDIDRSLGLRAIREGRRG